MRLEEDASDNTLTAIKDRRGTRRGLRRGSLFDSPGYFGLIGDADQPQMRRLQRETDRDRDRDRDSAKLSKSVITMCRLQPGEHFFGCRVD